MIWLEKKGLIYHRNNGLKQIQYNKYTTYMPWFERYQKMQHKATKTYIISSNHKNKQKNHSICII